MITEETALAFIQQISSSIQKTDNHWLWRGTVRKDGYGVTSFLAHRLVYELMVGRIPDGLVIDHICRKRNCVNPAHLRVVTYAENNACGMSPTAIGARRKKCLHGHLFSPQNTVWHMKRGRPSRVCRKCVKRQNDQHWNKYKKNIYCVFCAKEKEPNRIKKAKYCLSCAERRKREGILAHMRRRRASVRLSKTVA